MRQFEPPVFLCAHLVLQVIDLRHHRAQDEAGNRYLAQRPTEYEGPFNSAGDLIPDIGYESRKVAADAFKLLIPRGSKASFFEIVLDEVPYADANLSGLTPKLLAAQLRQEGRIGLMRVPRTTAGAPYEFVIVDQRSLAPSVISISRWTRRFLPWRREGGTIPARRVP